MAERQIRRDLVIETIAEKEGLAATEKDLDDRIAEQAEKSGSESRPDLRAAREERPAEGDRAQHHRRQSLQVAAGQKRCID